jgi:hypothetical protein
MQIVATRISVWNVQERHITARFVMLIARVHVIVAEPIPVIHI